MTWFDERRSPLRGVAYFSPEFGVAETLPQYSGGLGVLAGDHLKAAGDLGVPLVGVGLFYRQGYFHQALDEGGWQHERYYDLDPDAIGLVPADAEVEVDLAGTTVRARAWRLGVGRVPLFFLDAEGVTDRLYGGDTEHRLRQEIVLGIGGVRLLSGLGLQVQVFHSNEGHAGFLALERIRQAVVEHGLSFEEAVASVRHGGVFTTHTPVPAGIDRFPRPLMERYFGRWATECGTGLDALMALGHEPGESPDAPFNMAVMGLRLSGRANAVSRLHAEVSRRMFAALGVPIDAITNGVHAPTWGPSDASIADLDDKGLWGFRRAGRGRLVELLRERRAGQLDADVLTIGFARRFAAYKRATLLLSQPDRLRALVLSADRPVQLVFAGKAHPADREGKELIRQVATFARQADVRQRMAFVEDYDIAVARTLIQGCDVWLNTPRRPQEACGTSGMKAVLNGALHCSVLDGWWDEMFDGENGWAIPSAEEGADLARRDQTEAAALFDLLEDEIVPLYYDRDDEDVPRRWLGRVRTSLRSLGTRVTADRMVREYVERFYEPAAAESSRAFGGSTGL